jgi:hypothetical protein
VRLAEVHWIVQNQDDIECVILDKNNIKGMGAVKVLITGFSCPLRNPPKKCFKGK